MRTMTRPTTSPTLRSLCVAAGLVLAPLVAHPVSAGVLSRPQRPRLSPVTAALKVLPGLAGDHIQPH